MPYQRMIAVLLLCAAVGCGESPEPPESPGSPGAETGKEGLSTLEERDPVLA